MAPLALDGLPDTITAADLPEARGPVTERIFASLRQAPHDISWPVPFVAPDADDLHLALYCCYELHYHGLPGVDPDWEWQTSLLSLRNELERQFLSDLQAMVGAVEADADTVVARLWNLAASGDGPSLSGWVADHADLDQVRELAIHRSAYQLKEADPHTWGIPRLAGEAKAAMVSIQADEYGNGDRDDMHGALFGQTMNALDLNASENFYLDRIPGVTLATTNLISMLGLHRRWRGALVGHLALFEMTSVGPMTRYGDALRRLGIAENGCAFYDVHVDVDEGHQEVATERMVGGLMQDDPTLANDVLFGACALTAVEAGFSRHVLGKWRAGRSSLRWT